MPDPVRAGIYCRLSRAIDGSTEKVEDQERISRGVASQREWEVTEVYSDNSLSAWKKNRRRPAWDRMLADVDAGKLDALVIYHGDRLIRHPKDLETLLDLADGRGIKLAGPTGTRNLDNDDDRTMMRVEAAFAWRESANTSRRKKAGYERMRRKGLTRPGGKGGRAFGFEKDGVTRRPREAAIIRRAARAILRGRSVGSVAAGLRAQGALTTAGKPMSHNTLRRILVSPRTAGLMPDGEQLAAWEPVLGRDTWETVRAVLLANQANPRAGRGALHLLSGLAVCDPCGHVLYAGHNGSKPGVVAYRCPRPGCGQVTRNAALLDEYVIGAVTIALNDPAYLAAAIPADEGAAAEILALEQRRDETKATIEDLARHPGTDLALLARSLASFDMRLAELRGRIEGTARARLLGAHAGTTREGFRALPLDMQRALVAACVTVRVKRAGRRGGPGLRTDDIDLIPV
jgi:DNA invertase Pin-like site-specific DNA recombinase